MNSKLRVALGVIAVSLAINVAAFATGLTEYISAVINHGITITVNGNKVSLIDESGANYDPIIYNGRTYVPARFIANALGAKTNWNEKTSTVEIKTDTVISTTPYKDNDGTITTPNPCEINVMESIAKANKGFYAIDGENIPVVLGDKFTGCTDFKAFSKLGFIVSEYRSESSTNRWQSVQLGLDYAVSKSILSKDTELYKFWESLGSQMVKDCNNSGWFITESYSGSTDNGVNAYNVVKMKKGNIEVSVQSRTNGISISSSMPK